MIGWECPRCHRCYAPTVTECASCNAGVVTAPTPPVYVPVVVPQTLRPWPEWWPNVWCGDSTTGTLTVTSGSKDACFEDLCITAPPMLSGLQ